MTTRLGCVLGVLAALAAGGCNHAARRTAGFAVDGGVADDAGFLPYSPRPAEDAAMMRVDAADDVVDAEAGEIAAGDAPPACVVPEVDLKLPDDVVDGELRRAPAITGPSCAKLVGAGGPQAVFRLHVPERRVVELQVASRVDTAIAVRTACDDRTTDVVCGEDPLFWWYGPNGDGHLAVPQGHVVGDVGPSNGGVRKILDPGDYHVVVQAVAAGTGGPFTLVMRSFLPPQNLTCATAARLGDHAIVEPLDFEAATAFSPACGQGAPDPALFYAVMVAPGARVTATLTTLTSESSTLDIGLGQGCFAGSCVGHASDDRRASVSASYLNDTADDSQIIIALKNGPAKLVASGHMFGRLTIDITSPRVACGEDAAACPAVTPSCCAGGCVDLATDAANCGWCGHDCGGACAEGVCRPTTLASRQGTIENVVVDSTHVYWTSATNGTVMRIPVGGGLPTTLASEQRFPWGLAVTSSAVFWTDINRLTVMTAGLDGDHPTLIAAHPQDHSGRDPAEIEADAEHVFWLYRSQNNTQLLQAPVSGGEPTTLSFAPRGMKVGPGGVYWVEGTQLLKLGPEGGTPVVVADGLSGNGLYGTTLIAIDSTTAYLRDWVSKDGSAVGATFMKLPLAGGTPTTIATLDTASAQSFEVDATSLYYARGPTIMKLPLAGGPPVFVAKGKISGFRIAVDATSVYWADSSAADGSILKAAK